MNDPLTMDHFHQFVNIWTILRELDLNEEMVDDISWNLTESGQYTAKSAYKVQLMELHLCRLVPRFGKFGPLPN
jgi:hypothetical protein